MIHHGLTNLSLCEGLERGSYFLATTRLQTVTDIDCRDLDEPMFVMLGFAKLKVASVRVVFDGKFVGVS